MSNDTPTEVYLCQVSERVSCGACCGLYNVADLSRGTLEKRLIRRTECFSMTDRSEDGIEGFRRDIEGWTPEDRPFPRFHHCPFLGLMGTGLTRVGCLLHPDAPGNGGRDFRHLSYYGARACQTYFCPASKKLPGRFLLILRELLDDWYSYGLIITEHALLGAFMEMLEGRIGRRVRYAEFRRNRQARRHLNALVGLKLSWPFRRGDASGPCHFVFDNGLYTRPEIRWPGDDRPSEGYQVIFRELESEFTSEQDMHAAVNLLDDIMQPLAEHLLSYPPAVGP